MSESREKTDWAGNKYTEHYDSDGRIIGESREKTDWAGNKYTEHRDIDGGKLGESREKEYWTGTNYNEYINNEGRKVAESTNKTNFTGSEFTEYRDTDGHKIGESRIKNNWTGSKYTENTGIIGFNKLNKLTERLNTQDKKNTFSGTSNNHSSASGISDFIGSSLFIVLAAVLCVGTTFGAIWVFEHTTYFSFAWWLSLIVALVTGYFSIQILLGLAVLLGAILLIIWLIDYLFKHPW